MLNEKEIQKIIAKVKADQALTDAEELAYMIQVLGIDEGEARRIMAIAAHDRKNGIMD